MGRKSQYSIEAKLEAIRSYHNGKIGVQEIKDKYGMAHTTLLMWARIVEASGNEGLFPKARNASYSSELKQSVVDEYLRGEGSYQALAIKYHIPSKQTIENWVNRYNGHRELRDYDPKGAVYMTPSRKTTFEERVEIIRYCLAHEHAYKLAAEHYTVSYAQVYQWMKKYETHGEAGLKDGRGHRIAEEELNELERLKRENARLRQQVELKDRENILLKKVQEFERRRYSPKPSKNRNT